MRQVCPHCMAAVDVPAMTAGGDYECPVCRKRFAVPKAYTPTVDPSPLRMVPLPPTPAPPPPAVEKPSAPPGFVPGGVTPPPPSSEYSHTCGISLTPGVCHWLPVSCLTLTFVLSFFAWVVIAPEGIRAYTQSPWESLFKTFYPDPVAEPVLEAEKVLLENLHSTWLFLLPYLFGLLALVSLAWVDRLFVSSRRVAMPSPLVWIEPIWPYRLGAMTAGAGLLLFLIALQSAKGFGLESAATAARAAEAANLPGMKEKIEAADTSVKKHKIEIETAKATAYLTTEGTTAKAIAIWLHVFALAGLLGRVWVSRRGAKPLPKFEIKW